MYISLASSPSIVLCFDTSLNNVCILRGGFTIPDNHLPVNAALTHHLHMSCSLVNFLQQTV